MTEKARPFLKDFTPVKAANARRHGRLLCQDVRCSLGAVVDLSASGMRVRCDGPPPRLGEPLKFSLPWSDGSVELSGMARWLRSKGADAEVGIEFLDITPEQRRVLIEIARTTAHAETIRPDVERFRSAGNSEPLPAPKVPITPALRLGPRPE